MGRGQRHAWVLVRPVHARRSTAAPAALHCTPQVVAGSKEVAVMTGAALGAAATTVGHQVCLLVVTWRRLSGCRSLARSAMPPLIRCLFQHHTAYHPRTHTPPPTPEQVNELDHKLRISERATAAGAAIKDSTVGGGLQRVHGSWTAAAAYAAGSKTHSLGGGWACRRLRPAPQGCFAVPTCAAAAPTLAQPQVGRSTSAAFTRVGSAVSAGTRKVLDSDKVGVRARGGRGGRESKREARLAAGWHRLLVSPLGRVCQAGPARPRRSAGPELSR